MSTEKGPNFLEEIIAEDISKGKNNGRVLTRFPPEPNGYLHIGHAKSICVNFGLAKEFNGQTNLRFDDTNPEKEETEYVDSIKEDIKWLGFNWANEFYASDYFEQMYGFAVDLIKQQLAYVDDSTAEEIANICCFELTKEFELEVTVQYSITVNARDEESAQNAIYDIDFDSVSYGEEVTYLSSSVDRIDI